MKQLELLQLLTKYAKEYHQKGTDSLERNRHMHQDRWPDSIRQTTIDAVLVDYINFIAANYYIDYALYTKDLQNQPPTRKPD